ncbi:SLC13 family permease [Catenuloplanes japonicus]|uniref:SLC13 family permease n=1 Tax=Catenuloplanes japonicus TaxID=33876 RepID=UPI000526397F|nr:SLC13 family permease [Catenuloplanes japonicus]
MDTIVALLVLAVVLAFAVARPRGLPEATAAVPAALLVVLTGLVGRRAAWDEVVELGPTVAFLAAVLVLSALADEAGVFAWAGRIAAARGKGSPARLLGIVFVLASLVTAVLSLDATVVLLTPVVLRTARAMRAPTSPHVYACAHLANSASLLLPVSNLTNLLAFAASGLTFASFAGLMALPWLVVIAAEYVIFRLFFAKDLRTLAAVDGAGPGASQAVPAPVVAPAVPVPPPAAAPASPAVPAVSPAVPAVSPAVPAVSPAVPAVSPAVPATGDPAAVPGAFAPEAARGPDVAATSGARSTVDTPAAPRPPGVALAVLAATLIGFPVGEVFGVHPGWVAALGALVLAVPRMWRAPLDEGRRLLRAVHPAFLIFVPTLGIVVLAVRDSGFGTVVGHLVPDRATLPGLLAAAALAALLANLLNNLPATLMLVPLTAGNPGLTLAVLLGVNLGPNLTYVGSLATLLWRQVLHAHDHRPGNRRFMRLGVITVPVTIVAGTVALWISLRIAG